MKTLIFTLLFATTLVFSINGNAIAKAGTTKKASVDTATFNVINFNSEVVEDDLTIESWMADDNYWNNSSKNVFETEEEKALEIEDWMINHAKWDQKEIYPRKFTIVEDKNGTVYVFKSRVVKEPALKVERWMIDYRYWN